MSTKQNKKHKTQQPKQALQKGRWSKITRKPLKSSKIHTILAFHAKSDDNLAHYDPNSHHYSVYYLLLNGGFMFGRQNTQPAALTSFQNINELFKQYIIVSIRMENATSMSTKFCTISMIIMKNSNSLHYLNSEKKCTISINSSLKFHWILLLLYVKLHLVKKYK